MSDIADRFRVGGGLTRPVAIALATGFLTLAESAPLSAQTHTPPSEQLGRMVGTWNADVTMSDGTEFQGRVVYAWIVGRRALSSKTYFIDDGSPVLMSEGITAWHPREGHYVVSDVSGDGALSTGTLQIDGDVWQYRWSEHRATGAAEYRQELRFTTEDRLAWQIWQRTGDAWVPIMTAAEFTRAPEPPRPMR